ncbi:MAG: O-antigen ligase family protein, partial [Akkermansiaceae bacterium]|nr:O-antigen ligase family protein [Akkermansiaceae bacterium]
MARTSGRQRAPKGKPGKESSPAGERPLTPGRWVLLATLLVLILPNHVTYHDETLNIFIGLVVAALALAGLWLRRKPGLQLPWVALPPLVLGTYLLVLWGLGTAGYHPHFPIVRLLLTGALIAASFNHFSRDSSGDLIWALRWLVIIMALAYFPLTRWDPELSLVRDRYRFTFSHANVLGCFLVLAYPILLVHPWLKQGLGLSRGVSIASIVCALFLAGVVESRMALLLMIPQTILITAMGARRRLGLNPVRSVLGAVAVAAVAVGGLVLAFGRAWMTGKFARLVHGEESGREYLWKAVSRSIADNPLQGLAGHGSGILYKTSWDFPIQEFKFFLRGKAEYFSHNQFLDWTLEGGLVGALCFLAFAGLLLWSLGQAWRQAAKPDEKLLRAGFCLSALAIILFGQVSIASQQAVILAIGGILMGAVLKLSQIPHGLLPLPRRALPALLGLTI